MHSQVQTELKIFPRVFLNPRAIFFPNPAVPKFAQFITLRANLTLLTSYMPLQRHLSMTLFPLTTAF